MQYTKIGNVYIYADGTMPPVGWYKTGDGRLFYKDDNKQYLESNNNFMLECDDWPATLQCTDSPWIVGFSYTARDIQGKQVATVMSNINDIVTLSSKDKKYDRAVPECILLPNLSTEMVETTCGWELRGSAYCFGAVFSPVKLPYGWYKGDDGKYVLNTKDNWWVEGNANRLYKQRLLKRSTLIPCVTPWSALGKYDAYTIVYAEDTHYTYSRTIDEEDMAEFVPVR
jgi:hypothetical protein